MAIGADPPGADDRLDPTRLRGRQVEIHGHDGGPEHERTLVFVQHGRVPRDDHAPLVAKDRRNQTIVVQRQIGWLGQSGNVYNLDEGDIMKANEPGSFGPLYIDVER